MQLAQKLYQEGHITYMRTESKKYSREFLKKIESYFLGKNIIIRNIEEILNVNGKL